MIGSMMDGLYHAHAALLSLKPDGLPLWKYFFYVQTGLGWVYGTAGLTGCCLLIILTIMVLCSLPCVRRKGYFEVSAQSMIRRKGVEGTQGSLHHFERWGGGGGGGEEAGAEPLIYYMSYMKHQVGRPQKYSLNQTVSPSHWQSILALP